MAPLKVYLCDITHDTVILVSDTIPVNLGYVGSYAKKIHGDSIDISLFKYPNDVIQKIKKDLFWEINKIEIYNEQNNKEKILNFNKTNKTLFSIFKNNNLYDLLIDSLKNNKNFNRIIIKDKSFYKTIIKNKKYDLIINCDANNEISKKYFYRKFLKNYQSHLICSIEQLLCSYEQIPS